MTSETSITTPTNTTTADTTGTNANTPYASTTISATVDATDATDAADSPAPGRAGLLSMDSLLKYSPVATVVLDSSLTVVQVSQAYLQLADRKLDSVLGWDIYDLVRAGPSILDVECLRHGIETAKLTRKVYSIPDIESPDKTYWNIRIIPIVEGNTLLNILLEVHDTTEQRRKQLSLEQQFNTNDTYRILIQTVRDYAIFMLDTRGCVATWNLGAQLLKGYTKEDIIGKHFSNFYGQDDKDARKPQIELECAVRDGRVEDEGWRYRKDGTRFWANVIITPVYRGSTLIGYSKVTRDLTERKAAEARLISAYEETAKLKSEFLANMSHEIRTPMHGMLSALALLMDTRLNPEQMELANIIQESGGVLLQVINDILDYSKLASGQFSISQDVISIPDIISSVARSNQTSLSNAITLTTSVSPKVPKAAEGDPLRYRQIVQNLVSNAVKFTEAGSIHVSVTVDDEDDSGYTIRTEVTDTGIGVPTYAADSLFTPFTQFDNSATKRYKGTGLGLSICKSLSQLMGGRIGHRPNLAGPGSIFWFTARVRRLKIPAAGSDDAEQDTTATLSTRLHSTSISSTSSATATASKTVTRIDSGTATSTTVTVTTTTSPPPGLVPTTTAAPKTPDTLELLRQIAPCKRILLAEDNPINRRVMLRTLARLGFPSTSIDTATDGAAALRLALASRRPLPSHDLPLTPISPSALELTSSNSALGSSSADDTSHATPAYDLILMDINMPVLDGVEATRRIRERGISTPVIALTANALKGCREAYLARGMSDYLPKPVERQALVTVVGRWLGVAGAGAAAGAGSSVEVVSAGGERS